MKNNLLLLLLLLLLIFVSSTSADYCDNYSCDGNGWTTFTPSSDTRIMYVSASGNDATAQFYLSSDSEIGADPFNPIGSINEFATYAAAFANTREGYSDWILYKRGDTFYESPGSNVRSGRSYSEPFLIGSYGNSGNAPLIKTDRVNGIRIAKESPSKLGTFEFIAVQGINFYSYTRNPDDPNFLGYLESGGDGASITTYNDGNYVKDILVEGCSFSYYSSNIVTQGNVANITLRRNVILNAYAIDSHAQGLFAAGVDSLYVEENIFDHNGWLIQSESNDRTNGGATFHNHNIYTDGVQNGTFIKNIFLRASSIGTKLQGNSGIYGMIVDNNLYIDGEIGIESCNNYQYNSYRVHNPIVSNNVFYQLGLSNPTSRNVGWGMWIQGWDGGSINDNIVLGQRGQFFIRLGEESRGIDVSNNIGMLTDMVSIYQDSTVDQYDITIHDNYFERVDEGISRHVYSTGSSIAGLDFTSNTYYSPGTSEFRVSSGTYDFSYWTTNYEPDAKESKRIFIDDSRNPVTYMGYLGETESLDAFIEKVRSFDRYNWDERFTAPAVNAWIKAGFVETNDNSNNTQGSYLSADTDESGDISLTELNSYVQLWRVSQSVSLSQLIEAINNWKTDSNSEPEPCVPNTCGQDDCGTISDGCSGTIDCGACEFCGDGSCNNDETCSSCASDCGACPCTPITNCGSVECGSISDGCSGNLNCGVCSLGFTCSSGTCIEAGSNTIHSFTGLPIDNDGWTDFSAMINSGNYDDSRVVFVSSSSGDDSTAQVYDISILSFDENGMFQNAIPINSYATISEAYNQIRDGYADIILLKRGDDWSEGLGGYAKNGLNQVAPHIIASYGVNNARPILIDTTISTRDVNYLIVSGIEFHSPDWLSASRAIDTRGNPSHQLFEDLFFNETRGDIIQGQNGEFAEYISFRRCHWYHGEAHDGQIFAGQANNVLMEENIFYEPYDDDFSDKTRFGRFFYFTSEATSNSSLHDYLNGVIMRGNIFYNGERDAVDLRSGGDFTHNLVVASNYNYFGGRGGSENTVQSVNIEYNAFLEGPPNVNGYNNIQLINIDGGVVNENIVSDNTNIGPYGNVISIRGDGVILYIARDITISNNIFYGRSTESNLVTDSDLTDIQNIKISNNDFQLVNGRRIISHKTWNSGVNRFEGFTYSGNRYYSSSSESSWFSPGGDFDGWVSESSEIDAQSIEVSYSDADRTIGDYSSYIGIGSTTDDFMQKTLLQSRFNWNDDYTSVNVINYVREGFDKSAVTIDYTN